MDLPTGWEERWSERKHRAYWINKESGQSVWDRSHISRAGTKTKAPAKKETMDITIGGNARPVSGVGVSPTTDPRRQVGAQQNPTFAPIGALATGCGNVFGAAAPTLAGAGGNFFGAAAPTLAGAGGNFFGAAAPTLAGGFPPTPASQQVPVAAAAAVPAWFYETTTWPEQPAQQHHVTTQPSPQPPQPKPKPQPKPQHRTHPKLRFVITEGGSVEGAAKAKATAAAADAAANAMDTEVDVAMLHAVVSRKQRLLFAPRVPSQEHDAARGAGAVAQQAAPSWDARLASAGVPTLYIVLDTNVFLSNLGYIKLLSGTKHTVASPAVCLVVPSVVIRELDGLKLSDRHDDLGEAVAAKARAVIRWTNGAFEAGLLAGESWQKEKEANDLIPSGERQVTNDERVVACALLLKAEGQAAVLFTNDRNMINTAFANQLTAKSSATFPMNEPAVGQLYLAVRPTAPPAGAQQQQQQHARGSNVLAAGGGGGGGGAAAAAGGGGGGSKEEAATAGGMSTGWD